MRRLRPVLINLFDALDIQSKMIKTKEINTVKVRPIRLENQDTREVKGADLFNLLYANISLVARKNSGKTTVIFKILKETVDKDTHVVVFGGTSNTDPAWIAIKTWLEEHEIPHTFYTEIVSPKGVNMLQTYIEAFKEVPEEPEEEEKPKAVKYDDVDPELSVKVRKKRAKKYQTPAYFFVFDDMSAELRNSNISVFLKQHRHWKTKVLISSQGAKDIRPDSVKQIDYLLLFGGLQDNLKELYEKLYNFTDYETFEKCYKFATAEKYNFLYIDFKAGEFRKNFNERIIIDTKKTNDGQDS